MTRTRHEPTHDTCLICGGPTRLLYTLAYDLYTDTLNDPLAGTPDQFGFEVLCRNDCVTMTSAHTDGATFTMDRYEEWRRQVRDQLTAAVDPGRHRNEGAA